MIVLIVSFMLCVITLFNLMFIFKLIVQGVQDWIEKKRGDSDDED